MLTGYRASGFGAVVILTALLPSWQIALDSANKSPQTIKDYVASVRKLATFLQDHGMPDDLEAVDAEHILAFLVEERERTSAASAQKHYRNLHIYFRWIKDEGERAAPNPMDRGREARGA